VEIEKNNKQGERDKCKWGKCTLINYIQTITRYIPKPRVS